MTTDKNQYDPHIMEFLQVAVEFCAFLERCQGAERREFMQTLLKLLPLLYLKANMLPRIETSFAFLPDDKVTEEDYNFIRHIVYDIMQEDDDFEEFVYDGPLQTEESTWKSVSECLADMYQALRNFVAIYEERLESCMNDALSNLMENFDLYWGEALVDCLRRLHKLYYMKPDEDTL